MDRSIPFILENDWTLMAQISDEGKMLRCFAEVACNLMARSGCTKLQMVDHDTTPMVEDS